MACMGVIVFTLLLAWPSWSPCCKAIHSYCMRLACGALRPAALPPLAEIPNVSLNSNRSALPPPAEIPRVPPTALSATLHHPRDGDLARRRRGSHRGGRQPPQRGIVRGRRCCRRCRRRQPRLQWVVPRAGPALHYDGRVRPAARAE